MDVQPPLTFVLSGEDTVYARPTSNSDRIRVRIDGDKFFFDVNIPAKVAAVFSDSLIRALKPTKAGA